jgi:hypothetical protein
MRPTGGEYGMRMRSSASLAALAIAAALALAGCGGGTETVSVSGSGAAANGNAAATTATSTAQHPASSAGGGSAQGAATQTTRTATAPEFTKETPTGEGVGQAVAVVKAHGFTPNDDAQYRPGQTLRVLVATRTGSADGYAQQAFFFVGNRYIGTDTSAPSAGVRLVSQSDTEATLAYRLYRPDDSLCCARGGEATVRFQLDNGHLTALDPIPATSASSGTSRR